MPDAPPTLPGYAHVYSGKVRDLYAPVDPASGEPRPDRLLLVASDRISAYDFVLDTPIPDKGEVLTRLSLWWFAQLEDLVPNHVVTADVPDAVRGRGVLVERLEMLPVECVARAYLTGGGLGEYTATGAVSGIPLPAGLVDGDRLEQPIFTPSTKAAVGEHDEPIPYEVVEAQLGAPLAAQVRDLTVAILRRGNEIAAARGILLADTKVEFGLRGDEVVPAAAARRRRRADARQVRRGLRAAHRRDLLTAPRAAGRTPERFGPGRLRAGCCRSPPRVARGRSTTPSRCRRRPGRR
jgi:phosphoribosylaminoimidazole-succinocarboxamide synthase